MRVILDDRGLWCRRLLSRTLALGLALNLGGGCFIKRMTVNRLGDALAGGGTTFASDNDPNSSKPPRRSA